ncbi:hypothetical protein ACIB24_03600 [Spongisporangium articulatum]|uniref:Uncharacterized protein n=1 Tax=Spongisporangium articulatum TaxID=3362603 RepID=A0ABW8AJ07_9ACTN
MVTLADLVNTLALRAFSLGGTGGSRSVLTTRLAGVRYRVRTSRRLRLAALLVVTVLVGGTAFTVVAIAV